MSDNNPTIFGYTKDVTDEVRGTVQDRMEYLNDHVEEFIALLRDALSDLGAKSGAESAVDAGGGGGGGGTSGEEGGVQIDPIEEYKLSISLPDVPKFQGSGPGFSGTVPAKPELDFSFIGAGDALVFPDAPTPYQVNPIDVHRPSVGAAPARVDVDVGSVEFPDEPELGLDGIDKPHREAIVLPDVPVIDLPVFNAVPPNMDHITPPDVFVSWTEPPYQSELLDELVAWVRTHMQGGTGLPAAVEDALFSRARERDSAEAKRELQQVVDEWAARGFTAPPGMLAKQREALLEGARMKSAELNRDILIEAAKWEIEGIRFAVERGIALEQLLENLWSNILQRKFEAAKFRAESQIQVYNAQVAYIDAQVKVFGVLADAHKVQIEGKLAELRVYRGQLEGQQIIGQLNQQEVERYKAELSAVSVEADIYKARIDGARAKVEALKAQAETYRTAVQAYAQEIAAEKAIVDADVARIQAEGLSVQAYDTSVKAYSARVGAEATKQQAKNAEMQVMIEGRKAELGLFDAQLRHYISTLQEHMKGREIEHREFLAEIEGYKANTQALLGEAGLAERHYDATIRNRLAYAEVTVKELDVRLRNAIAQAELEIKKAQHKAELAQKGADAIARYAAQAAAGAMSALSTQVSLRAGADVGARYSGSNSRQENHNYQY